MYVPKPATKYFVLIAFLSFFIVTVNAAMAVSPGITASAATGSIYACAGSASASPQVQQFTVSGSNLTANITAAAPTGFEISLNATSEYGTSITITQAGGTVSNTIIYVRSASSAATGNISGNVILSSTGAQNQTVAVTGVVNALPTVNKVTNQTVSDGAATTAVNFSGTENTVFNWVNDTPGIGLPATGVGNIGAFTAVNTGTGRVTATITATPVSEGFAYIANSGSGNLSVINVATNTIVSTITPRSDPFCVCISPDGSKAYIGCSGGSSSINVINTLTNEIISTIPVSSTGESTGITVSPDGTMLYVANYVDNTVTAVNAITGTVVAVIPVGPNPYGIAISHDGSKVYVAFTYSNFISVINTATNMVAANITTGSIPGGIAISPDGSKLYVSVSNNIDVINPVTDNITAVIPTGAGAGLITFSPDGTKAYVTLTSYSTYPYPSSVQVINTATNAVLSTIKVGAASNGISISPDGHFVYVTNTESNSVSVINTSTNAVIATVNVGISPTSLGNFVTGGTGCTGAPTVFTITVTPTPKPTITAGTTSGSIYSCLGMASASPNVQQFTVSGNNLTGDISAAAPVGFEISTDLNGDYANTLTLTESGGIVNNTTIYVRTAATATAGSLTGQIALTSPGVTTINAAVQGEVLGAGKVNLIQPQTVTNGLQTQAIDFTGTATTYIWSNDTPAIGLPASGTGATAPFTAINNSNNPIIATITVTPITSGNAGKGGITCTGTPITFTIMVDPTPPTTITTQGTLQPLTTTYGTTSSSAILHISGAFLTEGILVTPPSGFEISTDNTKFTRTLTLGAGGDISMTPVYFRLAASTPVGQYSGNIVLSSAGLSSVNVNMPPGTVKPTLLTITANNKSRIYDTTNPVLTVSYAGFVNNEDAGQLTMQPQVITLATINSPVGNYPIIVSGASSLNYTFVYVAGVLTIDPPLLIIPNTFTPNNDGINDTWEIKYLENYPNCVVNIFNRYGENLYSSIGYPIPWDGKYKGVNLPAGTYYYIIDTKSTLRICSGYITIIR